MGGVLNWDKKYRDALAHGERCIGELSGIITAFNTNLDAIWFVGEELERIAEGRKLRLDRLPQSISSIDDLVSAILVCMKNGRSAELLIESEVVANEISSVFRPHEVRIGGLAGIQSNVLSRLGVRRIFPHVASLPEEQARVMEKRNVLIACGDGSFRDPESAVRDEDRKLVHWIFEFKRGTKLKVGDEEIQAPESNRFIATWDELNTRVEIDGNFSRWIGKVLREVDRAIVSGFHLLRRRYPEGVGYEYYLNRAVEEIRRWKEINPKLIIHFEHAHTEDLEITRSIFESLGRVVDCMGFNETELPIILRAFGMETRNGNVKGLYDGLIRLADLLKVRRINLHTRDFLMSVLREFIPPEREQLAMIFGSCVAANRALTGEFGDIEQIKRNIWSLDLSEIGMKSFHRLCEIFGSNFSMNGYNDEFVFSPTRVTMNPKSTVGLGDAVSAGLVVAER